MSLIATLNKDIIAAHKAGNSTEVGILRLLMAPIKNREIEKRAVSADPLTDAEEIEVLTKEAKKRKEAIEIFIKGGRKDLADKEQMELDIIYRYIPRQMTEEEVEAEVAKVLAENPSKEFSVVMKDAMARLKGRADGNMVSKAIKAKLG